MRRRAWEGTRATAVELHEWVDETLPTLAADGEMVAAFPTADEQRFVVPPLGMKEDLEAELSLYE